MSIYSVLLSGPDFLGPEVPPLLDVFPVVSDNVGFLEEEAHGVGQFELICQPRLFLPRSSKETRETFPNQTGNVVAVQIPVLNLVEVDLARSNGLVSKVGHTVFHLFTNFDDDVPIPDSIWD